MEFHVAQLLREPVGSLREQQIREACPADEGASFPLEGDIQLLRTDAGILVTADLATTICTLCSRCLTQAGVPVRLEIEEEFYPTVDVATGAPLPPPDEPTPFLIDEHHILDICEAVRQQRILAEPMQPLCRPNCAGLCADCGADLNKGSCACPPAGADARWEALRELAKVSER